MEFGLHSTTSQSTFPDSTWAFIWGMGSPPISTSSTLMPVSCSKVSRCEALKPSKYEPPPATITSFSSARAGPESTRAVRAAARESHRKFFRIFMEAPSVKLSGQECRSPFPARSAGSRRRPDPTKHGPRLPDGRERGGYGGPGARRPRSRCGSATCCRRTPRSTPRRRGPRPGRLAASMDASSAFSGRTTTVTSEPGRPPCTSLARSRAPPASSTPVHPPGAPNARPRSRFATPTKEATNSVAGRS